MSGQEDAVLRRDEVAAVYCKRLLKKELESRLRAVSSTFTDIGYRYGEVAVKIFMFGCSVKEDLNAAKKELKRTEEILNSFKSAAQVLGEVVNPLENERFLVEVNNTTSYLVGCESKVNKEKLISGTRVALDMASITIRRFLPPKFNPFGYSILRGRRVKMNYSAVGGLSDQLRELRECIELPLMNPELFLRVGVKPPKAILLYGPPGTGKTLLAKLIAINVDANFLKVGTSVMVSGFLGHGARTICELMTCARDNQPCIIFIDEIDTICGRRLRDGTGTDREIQRTMMELLNQLDGFDQLGKVKMLMTTNRPDMLDPALLRPGRIDKKIEIPLPNEHSRLEILKVHAARMAKQGEIDYEAVVKLSEGFNGADLRNVCTEAGTFAIRAGREHVIQEDLMKAVRKLKEVKKLEASAHYRADFGKD
ncbi:hypothetical protein V6N13_082929 [Hibiscus sabdariffa]|uniref:AAA+ ATPase domain-containing protein n=1 Tax=Hibiscus sabdariffa TaxID=183260 RepID=A0ABR2BZH2_9ROSI